MQTPISTSSKSIAEQFAELWKQHEPQEAVAAATGSAAPKETSVDTPGNLASSADSRSFSSLFMQQPTFARPTIIRKARRRIEMPTDLSDADSDPPSGLQDMTPVGEPSTGDATGVENKHPRIHLLNSKDSASTLLSVLRDPGLAQANPRRDPQIYQHLTSDRPKGLRRSLSSMRAPGVPVLLHYTEDARIEHKRQVERVQRERHERLQDLLEQRALRRAAKEEHDAFEGPSRQVLDEWGGVVPTQAIYEPLFKPVHPVQQPQTVYLGRETEHAQPPKAERVARVDADPAKAPEASPSVDLVTAHAQGSMPVTPAKKAARRTVTEQKLEPVRIDAAARLADLEPAQVVAMLATARTPVLETRQDLQDAYASALERVSNSVARKLHPVAYWVEGLRGLLPDFQPPGQLLQHVFETTRSASLAGIVAALGGLRLLEGLVDDLDFYSTAIELYDLAETSNSWNRLSLFGAGLTFSPSSMLPIIQERARRLGADSKEKVRLLTLDLGRAIDEWALLQEPPQALDAAGEVIMLGALIDEDRLFKLKPDAQCVSDAWFALAVVMAPRDRWALGALRVLRSAAILEFDVIPLPGMATPLASYVSAGHKDAVALLIAAGLDPFMRDDHGRDARTLAKLSGQDTILALIDQISQDRSREKARVDLAMRELAEMMQA